MSTEQPERSVSRSISKEAPPQTQQTAVPDAQPAPKQAETPTEQPAADFVHVDDGIPNSAIPLPSPDLTHAHVAVFGSTGATGKWIVHELLNAAQVEKVYAFVRRVPSHAPHDKLVELLFNTDGDADVIKQSLEEQWPADVNIDAVFSAIGSTIKKAGSEEKFYAIDYTTNITIAQYAKSKNVPQFHMVSSASANANSSMFYLRTKGQLDDALQQLQFPYLGIYRPGILDGAERPESRTFETVAIWSCKKLLWWLNSSALSAARPIHVHDIARAIVRTWSQHYPLNINTTTTATTAAAENDAVEERLATAASPEVAIFNGSTEIFHIIDDMAHIQAEL